jgi:hypothetical protein
VYDKNRNSTTLSKFCAEYSHGLEDDLEPYRRGTDRKASPED